MTFVFEIQDQGFTGNKPISPLQFEIIFNGLRLSLTFTSEFEIWTKYCKAEKTISSGPFSLN